MTSDAIRTPADPDQPTIDRFLSLVPAPLRKSVEGILEHPARTRKDLLAELEGYTARVDAAARRRRDIDVNLSEGILRACRRLLDYHWSELDAEGRRLVQLACTYFVESDDGDRDLESVFGFDDDALVVNAVLEAIGHSEHKVRI